jgi:dimethylargininase
MPVAITRAVSATINECQLSYKTREPIDVAGARRQHRAYEQALESLGVRIQQLPALDQFPDAVFVEDPAIILDELAVICTPGVASRAAEGAAIEAAVAQHRPIQRIEGAGTLDGGDVVRIGRDLYVGRSKRTNDEGIAQLSAMLRPFDYSVTAVAVHGALHLKTACTYAGRDTLLANPEWADVSAFRGVRLLTTPEPWGASVLEVNNVLVMPTMYSATRAVLERAGFSTLPVDISELQKAEGGCTCLSLVIQ